MIALISPELGWIWAVVAVSVVQIVLAVLCGLLLGRSSAGQPSVAKPTIDPAMAHELVAQLQAVTSRVAAGVTEHQSKIERQNESLKQLADVQGDSLGSIVLDVVRQIMASNADLQKQLAEAEIALEQQRTLIKRYMASAHTDDLTGLPNRRAFNEHLARLMAQSERNGSALSLILLDLDRFKQLNDCYGHLAGDAVLREVAARLRGAVRDMDIAARFGGEEFAVLLPDTQGEAALVVAERVRQAVRDAVVKYEGKPLSVTVSQGVAEATVEDNAETLVARADEALYAAKAAGRNCTRLHDPVQGAPCEPDFEAGPDAADAEHSANGPADRTPAPSLEQAAHATADEGVSAAVSAESGTQVHGAGDEAAHDSQPWQEAAEALRSAIDGLSSEPQFPPDQTSAV